jgi:cell division protease FtsH
MVARLGMSERFGPIYLEHKSEHPFLGARIATSSGLSDATVHAIEEEARGLLAEALKLATKTLTDDRASFDRLVAALLDRETLEQADLDEVLSSGPPSGERRAAAS